MKAYVVYLVFPFLPILLCLLSLVPTIECTDKPNIVFILTDDQDVFLNGTQPISKTRKLIGDAGITFENMFATSPLCCPSRSSILTGKYVHNHGALNNSIEGNCSSTSWQKESESHAFSTYLKLQNYETFFAGKYLNQYGKKAAGGVEHVPPGWDHWNGLVGNSVYYNYSLSVNGKQEVHGDKYPDDYLTELIGRRAEDFLKSRSKLSKPFFMMLSTPAAHSPFTPAPKYGKEFSNLTAPRTKAYNTHSQDKHWLIRKAKSPMSNDTVKYIDGVFRDRWRTLLTVDDIVETVVNTLTDKKLIDHTYIFFASDNGYHLGQFSLPMDKRQLYEFDIRVPLMVRGPGIKSGQKREEIVLNIDLAPTFIDLAGSTPPDFVDGQSITPLFKANSTAKSWRTDFVVEHVGEYQVKNTGCPQYDNQNMYNCFPDCVCEDSSNNTYACVRTIDDSTNTMYCQFADAENFVELFNLNKDPHQMSNIAQSEDPKVLAKLSERLVQLSVCSGQTCRKGFHYHNWN